ncbi:hypothetical protein BH11ARM2_BH11ARM2_12950 [soil metagenome]
MRRSVLIFSALACAWGCGGGGDATSQNNSSGPIVLALVGPVSSPVANEIAGLGPITGSTEEANLFVVDGDAFSGTMAEEKTLKEAWRKGHGLLVLDADEDDLERDLIRLTGIVPDKELAAVYLRKRKDGGIDQIHLDKSATGSSQLAGEMRQEFLRRVGVAFREELPVPELRKTARGDGRGFQLGPFPISKVLTQNTEFYTPVRSATVTLSDTITVLGSGSYGGQYPATAYVAFAGNGNSSVGHFDTYLQDGGSFLDEVYINGYANPRHERKIGLVLDQGQPILTSAQPANASGEKEVSSGFHVNVEVTPEGPVTGIGYSTDTATNIEGWTVEQKLLGEPGSVIEWTYQEQLDALGNNMDSVYATLFSTGQASDSTFGVYNPSLLATTLLQSAPMVVWTVQEADGAKQATVTSELTSFNTAWVREDPFIGKSGATWYLGDDLGNPQRSLVFSTDASVVIDLTQLWNQMGYLTSVDVPSTATPGQIPVTVTLDHPAPDAGMPVSLTSSAPGTVPSQQLVVPAGEKQFTFQIPIESGFEGNVSLNFVVNGLSKTADVDVQH